MDTLSWALTRERGAWKYTTEIIYLLRSILSGISLQAATPLV
jgi:hypothetical protein